MGGSRQILNLTKAQECKITSEADKTRWVCSFCRLRTGDYREDETVAAVEEIPVSIVLKPQSPDDVV